MGCDESLTVRVFIHVVACYSLIGCWGVDCDPCTLAPGATAAWLLDIGVCFSHSAVLIWDKIWPSPKHVWNEIILSRFFGSPLARSLARSPVVLSALCVWKTRLLFTWRRARGGGSKIAISAAAIPLPFPTIRSLQSFQGSSSSVWFDFLKILYVLDIVRRLIQFYVLTSFFRQRCVCRRGLLSDRFHFLGVAVFQDLKDLLVDSIFLKTCVFFLDNNVRLQFSFVCSIVFRERCVAEMLQRFCVRPLPFSRIRSLQRFERSFIWFDLRCQFSFVCWKLFRQRGVAEVL
jgi:hypothetical protein